MNPTGSRGQGISIRFWDFLFYASFGFVVTSSVAIAGVLLVFCYLIVPSVERCCSRIGSGRAWPSAGPWDAGLGAGCVFSVKLDTPTGATIVAPSGGAGVDVPAASGPLPQAGERGETSAPGGRRQGLRG